MKWLYRLLFLLGLPLWPAFWLLCRLTAHRCPFCGSKWRTELVGDWGGEVWKCHACARYWEPDKLPRAS